ncbi:MAG: hypothetical protein EOP04_08595 [Proteobacteria bacterium]|nr:MAG: hypothetical protein EOP04_08595 [Pseudomonadota bacterium]
MVKVIDPRFNGGFCFIGLPKTGKRIFSVSMILLKRGKLSNRIILTLNENLQTPAAFFLLRFTCIMTGDQIPFTLDASEDTSLFPDRYNEFDLGDISDAFAGLPTGFYYYAVFPLDAANEAQQSNAIEVGRMFLSDEAGQTATEYIPENPQTFKVYNGS